MVRQGMSISISVAIMTDIEFVVDFRFSSQSLQYTQ